MRASNIIRAVALLLIPSALGQANSVKNPKRGLVYISNVETPQDNQIWNEAGTDLSWYYNYSPSPTYLSTTLQFVPMLFSPPATDTDTSFSDTVKALIAKGQNISYVMTYNEPDGTSSTGGSDVSPSLGASTWIREIEPLRQLGIKVGAPAMTGAPSGFTWMTDFLTACNGSCTPDFIPIHWYDNFGGLASHMGQYRAAFPNLTQWITEYALSNSDLSDTEAYFNQTAAYFEKIDYVTHYSYFGSFRSSKSNVGPNVAMLDQNGHLTRIGNWYLGPGATSDASLLTIGGAWALFVVGVCFCVL